MAYPEFLQCCRAKDESFSDALSKAGESTVRSLARAWGSLSPIEKEATVGAAAAGVIVLGPILAGMGVEASEAVAIAVIALVGLGSLAAIDEVMNCARQCL